MEYPKIDTVWKRGEKTHRILEGEYSRPEFAAIDTWRVTEKVDGTNIRIIWRPKEPEPLPNLEFRGKSDSAQIPPPLLAYLHETFTPDKLKSIFPEDTMEVILFGEGFGGKIQAGNRYRKTEEIVLFDIWIDGWWLEFPNVADIAEKLGVRSVPFLGILTRDQAIDLVKTKFPSQIADDKTLPIEGVVATSFPMMMFRNGGSPIRWKLKGKDFREKVRS